MNTVKTAYLHVYNEKSVISNPMYSGETLILCKGYEGNEVHVKFRVLKLTLTLIYFNYISNVVSCSVSVPVIFFTLCVPVQLKRRYFPSSLHVL